MIKKLRNEQLSGTNSSKLGIWAANNFSLINNSVPTLLNTVNVAHKVLCSGGGGETWEEEGGKEGTSCNPPSLEWPGELLLSTALLLFATKQSIELLLSQG